MRISMYVYTGMHIYVFMYKYIDLLMYLWSWTDRCFLIVFGSCTCTETVVDDHLPCVTCIFRRRESSTAS